MVRYEKEVLAILNGSVHLATVRSEFKRRMNEKGITLSNIWYKAVYAALKRLVLKQVIASDGLYFSRTVGNLSGVHARERNTVSRVIRRSNRIQVIDKSKIKEEHVSQEIDTNLNEAITLLEQERNKWKQLYEEQVQQRNTLEEQLQQRNAVDLNEWRNDLDFDIAPEPMVEIPFNEPVLSQATEALVVSEEPSREQVETAGTDYPELVPTITEPSDQDQLSDQDNEISGLKMGKRLLEQRLSELEQALQNQEELYTEKVGQLEAKCEKLIHDHSELIQERDAEIDDLRVQKNQFEQRYSELEHTAQIRERELMQKADETQAKCKRLSDDLTKLEQEKEVAINGLEMEKKFLEQKLGQVEQGLQKRQEEFEQIILELEAKCAKYNRENNELEQDIYSISELVKTLQAKVDTMEDYIKEYSDEINRLKNEKIQLQESLSNATADLQEHADAQMQLNALTESNTNVQAELEKKNLECSELQKDLENQLEELSITSKSWKKSIVTINEDLISLKADYQALKEENNQKKDELSRLHQLTTQFTQTIAEKDLQIQKLTKSVKEIEEKAKADLEQTKKTLEDKLDLSVSENEAKLARLVSENRLIALKLEGEHQALLAATKELKNTRSAHESTMKEIETYKEKYQGFKEAIAEEVDNFVHGFLK